MGILKVLLCFLIFPFIFASSDCQFSVCGNNNILIRFPFQLETDQNPYCGYPGFKLTCTNDSNAVLNLPLSGRFYVRNISYLVQQIELYDPDQCLPKRLLSLNLSGSPFTAASSRNYTFFSCPTKNASSQFIPIDCLSNSTNFVSAFPSSVSFAKNRLPESCSFIGRVSVPVSTSYVGNSISNDVSQGLRLTWNKPDCRSCESQGLMCGFESTTSYKVKCATDFQTGTSRGLLIFRIITLCIVGPASTFAIVMAICVCYKDRMAYISSSRSRHTPSSAVTPQPELSITTTTTNGLDESTIESYEKLVLGESKRLPPGPNDGTCWICLSEYNSKETIRCIPECNHCFHAECIDEWLRMNSTCPVCRNTPSPSPAHHHHHHHSVSGDPLIG